MASARDDWTRTVPTEQPSKAAVSATDGPRRSEAPRPSAEEAPDAKAHHTTKPDPAALAEPDRVLPKDWRTSNDRAVAVTGDLNGLHVLVAEESVGYRWRTAATLADNTFDADQWIGQACVTGSGDRAVVVYAPRAFTNSAAAMNGGGAVAIVDLRDGAVTKVGMQASLAYYNPGCGVGETATVATMHDNGGAVTTTLTIIDASDRPDHCDASGHRRPEFPGSDQPWRRHAVLGNSLVRVSATGVVTKLSTENGVPFRLYADRAGGVAYEVAQGQRVQVRRFAGSGSTLLGTGALADVRLTATAGTVFVLGRDRTRVRLSGLTGWKALDVPVHAQPSTTGTLAVTGLARVADNAQPLYDQARPVTVAATITATNESAAFQLRPSLGRYNSPPAPVLRSFSIRKDIDGMMCVEVDEHGRIDMTAA